MAGKQKLIVPAVFLLMVVIVAFLLLTVTFSVDPDGESIHTMKHRLL